MKDETISLVQKFNVIMNINHWVAYVRSKYFTTSTKSVNCVVRCVIVTHIGALKITNCKFKFNASVVCFFVFFKHQFSIIFLPATCKCCPIYVICRT